jgi:hypothetical protein
VNPVGLHTIVAAGFAEHWPFTSTARLAIASKILKETKRKQTICYDIQGGESWIMVPLNANHCVQE